MQWQTPIPPSSIPGNPGPAPNGGTKRTTEQNSERARLR
jgi:hypothetical protein